MACPRPCEPISLGAPARPPVRLNTGRARRLPDSDSTRGAARQ
jgi:hypothetical protein